MHITKSIGDVAELRVAAKYIDKGFTVSRPLTDHAPYDLLIDDGIKISRVQIKARSSRDDKISVELYTSSANNYNRNYSINDFDIIAVYNIDSGEIAALTWKDIQDCKKAVVLRLNKPIKEYKNIRYFSSYLI